MTRYDFVLYLTQAGDNSQVNELFTGMIADWQRVIGVDCSATAVAKELISNVVENQRVSHGVAVAGGGPSAVLRICQRVLGTEHPLTEEVQRIIADLSPSVQSDGAADIG